MSMTGISPADPQLLGMQNGWGTTGPGTSSGGGMSPDSSASAGPSGSNTYSSSAPAANSSATANTHANCHKWIAWAAGIGGVALLAAVAYVGFRKDGFLRKLFSSTPKAETPATGDSNTGNTPAAREPKTRKQLAKLSPAEVGQLHADEVQHLTKPELIAAVTTEQAHGLKPAQHRHASPEVKAFLAR